MLVATDEKFFEI